MKKKLVKCDARSVNGTYDNWIVECPNCEKEHEYEGYFCSDDITECSCGTRIQSTRLWLDDYNYIH